MSPDTESEPPDVSRDLYAVVVTVHSACSEDLLEAIAGLDLTFNEIKLLHLLARGRRPPRIKQVALLLGVAAASASRIVEDLDDKHLVDRVPDERDGRVRYVVITGRGREALQQLATVRLAAVEQFTDGLSPLEREKLVPALRELCRRDAIAARRPTDA